jgi:hypothetical protein
MMATGILNLPDEGFDRLEKEPTQIVRIDLGPQQHRYFSRKPAGRCGLRDRGTTPLPTTRALILQKRAPGTIRLKTLAMAPELIADAIRRVRSGADPSTSKRIIERRLYFIIYFRPRNWPSDS